MNCSLLLTQAFSLSLFPFTCDLILHIFCAIAQMGHISSLSFPLQLSDSIYILYLALFHHPDVIGIQLSHSGK